MKEVIQPQVPSALKQLLSVSLLRTRVSLPHDHITPCWTVTAQAFANIAFIKYLLAKLHRTNCKDNIWAKDLSGWTFCPGVAPVFGNTITVQGQKT